MCDSEASQAAVSTWLMIVELRAYTFCVQVCHCTCVIMRIRMFSNGC